MKFMDLRLRGTRFEVAETNGRISTYGKGVTCEISDSGVLRITEAEHVTYLSPAGWISVFGSPPAA